MVNRDNVVTSESVLPQKKVAAKKQAAPKKKIVDEVIDEDSVVESVNFKNNEQRALLYFESGAGYVTSSGFKFTRAQPMGEVSSDEANSLLRLPNFRLPNDEEKEMYYNNLEG
jgi:hypothetical protein